jgi:CheY-like chemotaxis protein
MPYILLAENDDNDAFGMELAFARAGILERVYRVRDGKQAIDYLDGARRYEDRTKYPLPSVLLLDWKLPGASGADVLQWVRAHAVLKYLAVVVISNSSLQGDREIALDLGANSFVQKPGTFVEFEEMLSSLARFWRFNISLAS